MWDWEDRQRTKVVIPRSAALHSIHHPLCRSVKHISVVVCISASGVCFTPYVVTSQDSAAVRRDLEVDRMQIGRHLNLMLKHGDKPSVNADLFEDQLCSVFLPHLMITPPVKGLGKEDAVLLMDNCSSLRLSSNFSRVRMCTWLWLLSHRNRIPCKSSKFSI
jgi:hypothetical protein